MPNFQAFLQRTSIVGRFVYFACFVCLMTIGNSQTAFGFQDKSYIASPTRQDTDSKAVESSPTHPLSVEKTNGEHTPASGSRLRTLIFSLTIFVLSVFVGFEVIAKVPPTLHTPLMSGSNAISGITIVGSLIAAGHKSGGLAAFLGAVAIVFAMINVVGGFMVTHRMLKMFKKR